LYSKAARQAHYDLRLKVALGFNPKEHIPMVLGAAACRHFHPFAWKICSQLISVFSILCSALKGALLC